MKKLLYVFLAMTVAFAMVACSSGGDGGGGGGASSAKALTSITVAGEAPHDGIKAPISSTDWDDSDLVLGNFAASIGLIVIDDPADLDGAVIATSVSSGATATFAVVNDAAVANRGSITFTTVTTRDFSSGQLLFVKVTAQDGSVQYYAFRVEEAGSVTDISGLSVAGVTSGGQGIGAATWNGIMSGDEGLVLISKSDKNNATVQVTTLAEGATVELSKATGSNEPTIWVANNTALAFDDGDWLYIKVTARNGITIEYYKVEIGIGRNANLSDITLTNKTGTATPKSVDLLGVGDATLAGVTEGSILFRNPADVAGYTLGLLLEDPDATAKYVKAGEDDPIAVADIDEEYDPADKPDIIFADMDYLYVEVTSENGGVKMYYKIGVNFQLTATIQAGSPDFSLADPSDDSAWDDAIGEYEIRKILPLTSDTTTAYLNQGKLHPRYTTGKAKLLWDNDGLYARVEVTDPQVTATAASAGHHEADSFELFVNEKKDVTGTGSGYVNGNAAYGQYRLGANGERSGDPTPAVDAFNALNRTFAKKVTDGYIVVIQVPWKDKPDGEEYEAGFEFGLELQINACTTDKIRDGVMVWNNVAHSNYQNSTDYGLGVLAGVPPVHAQIPAISKQPRASTFAEPNQAITLSVTAAVTDGGDLTYQWYEAADAASAGTPIGGAKGDTYTPDTSGVGITYYYVEITNTNAAVDGRTTTKNSSTRARVEVGIYDAPATWEERIINLGRTMPLYGFNIGSATLADFTKVTFELKATEASVDQTMVNRVYGPFDVESPSATPDLIFNNADVGNATALANHLIQRGTDITDLATAYEDWETVTINLTTLADLDDNPDDGIVKTHAMKDLTGLVGLGIGPFVNGATGVVSYYIKDIKLYHSDGATVVSALYPEHPRLFAGEGAINYGRSYQNETLTRELVPTDTAIAVAVLAPVNDTLFAAVGDYNQSNATGAAAEKYTYNGKDYWIVADTRSTSWFGTPVAPFDTTTAAEVENTQKGYGTLGGYTRLGISLAAVDANYTDYSKVTITYEAVYVGGTNFNVLWRDSATAAGGSPDIATVVLPNGANQSVTFDIADAAGGGKVSTGGIGIVKSAASSGFLLRITKITFIK